MKNKLNKKIIIPIASFFAIILVTVLFSNSFLSKGTRSLEQIIPAGTQTGIPFEDAKTAIQEVMRDYYIRGPYIQYNYAKAYPPGGHLPKTYTGYSNPFPDPKPEEATSQDTLFLVCGLFGYDIYNTAFGMLYRSSSSNGSHDKFPASNGQVIDAVRKYYSSNVKSLAESKNDENFLLYYVGNNPETNANLNEDDVGTSDGVASSDTENVNTVYINGEKYNNNIEEYTYFTYEKDANGNYIKDENGNYKEGTKYTYGMYNGGISLSDFAKNIQPGDIFTYTGHVMVAYDRICRQQEWDKNPENCNNWDVLLLNSNQKGKIPDYSHSRIYQTSKLSYNIFKNTTGVNELINIPGEGTIQLKWLSEDTHFYNYPFELEKDENGNYIKDENGNYKMSYEGVKPKRQKKKKLSCYEEECMVIRPYYQSGNEAWFNFDIDMIQYNKTLLRMQYPGLFIEKTVNVGDNNSVNIGDELTYTIKIKNMSNTTKSKTYENGFLIQETINSEYVDFVSTTKNYNTKDNNKVTWVINERLQPVEIDENGIEQNVITIEYTVKVKNNIKNVSKTIESNGIFYADSPSEYISTGKVSNKIVPKVTDVTKAVDNTQYKTKYEECYNDAISKSEPITSLALIDYVYNCALKEPLDVSFNDFNFSDLYDKTITNSVSVVGINFKTTEYANKIKKMILNNYWNGLSLINVSSKYHVLFPKIVGGVETSRNRNRVIRPSDFKEGDVLIYSVNNTIKIGDDVSSGWTNVNTYERGTYAYIYINGKFVGVNGEKNGWVGPSGSTASSIRNNFTYSYWKDDYQTLYNNLYDGLCYLGIDTNWDCSKSPNTEEYYNKLSVADKKVYDKLTEDQKKVLEFVNYQTLYTKDDYIILRPELIIKQKSAIELTSLPTKTTYKENEDLDLTGLKVEQIYNNGETEDIISGYEVTGYDKTKLGKQTVKVTYGGEEITFEVVVQSDETLSSKLESKNYIINNNYVTNIPLNTKISDLQNELGSDVIIESETQIISTGTVIRKGNQSYTVVVKGDVNGDGLINSSDLLKVRKHLIHEITLDGAYELAGIFGNASKIDSTSLLKIQRHLLRISTIS